MPARYTPTRYPKGVTNVSPTRPHAFMGIPYRAKYHEFFDDFDNYEADQWVSTVTGSGTSVVQALDGGILKLTNSAADDDAIFSQWSGDDAAGGIITWSFETGKQLWFSARFSVSDATQSDVVCGLQSIDTTPLAVANGVFFRKADGSATMTLVACASSVELTVNCGTLVTDAMTEWAFYWDGVATLEAYKDGVKQAILVPAASLPSVVLAQSFGVQNGEAVAKSMSVDFLSVVKDRVLYSD
jgi:hypothetical protein